MWIVPTQLKTSFLTAQECGESNADLNEVASQLKQSLFWKSKPLSWEIWLRKWKQAYWLRPLFGQILKRSMQDPFVTRYMESLEDIRASHSVTPENEKVLKMKDTFGRIYLNTLKSSDRSGVILRMSEGTFQWDMKKYAAVYQILVTELRKESLLRRKLAHPIDESGSLFSQQWRTPASSDGEGGLLDINRKGVNPKIKLRDQAPHWPTPTSMIQEQTLDMFQNRKEKALAKHINGNGIGMNLGHAIQQWTTESSRDFKDTPGMIAEREDGRSRKDQLPRQVYSLLDKESVSTIGKNTARLNPAWSIQLMGTTLQKTFTALLVIRLWSKSQS